MSSQKAEARRNESGEMAEHLLRKAVVLAFLENQYVSVSLILKETFGYLMA